MEIVSSYRRRRRFVTNYTSDSNHFHPFPIIRVRDTHHIAEAQVEKNARLREAFGISEYFVEGTSFDPERKAKEDMAKSIALQQELEAQKEMDRIKGAVTKKYGLVRTPSPGAVDSARGGGDREKEKKKRSKDDDVERGRDKDKKKKRKHRDS